MARAPSPACGRRCVIEVKDGDIMIRSKSTYFTAAGSLALALGLSLRLWMHANSVNFISGFLLGVSIALLIGGLAGRSRGVSR